MGFTGASRYGPEKSEAVILLITDILGPLCIKRIC